MRSVAVIGAGITGLTAAFSLKRRGVPVRVYEATSRVGGVIRTTRSGGYLAESGPNTILETSPVIGRVLTDAGVAARRIDPSPATRARFVVSHRRPVEVPAGPLGLMTTPLFSTRAKLRVLMEPFVRRRRDGAEESVAQFVVRRLGAEFLDRAVDPMVAGIYAGDPHALSLTHAFPRIKALEDDYGSLILGQVLCARARRGEASSDRAPMFSFDEGLQVLPDALAADLGAAVTLDSPVGGITRSNEGWTVAAPGGAAEHAAVLFCGTGPSLASLRLDGEPLAALSMIRYAPVASVVLGFRREEVAHPCAGFGLLVPRVEGLRILGTIFSSSLFPGRAPEGHLALTSYVGGDRHPELASLPAEQLETIVRGDLRALLGATGAPTFRHHAFYPQAIPQYEVGYGRVLARMAEIEARAPGFFIAGHVRDGVSLGASISAGVRAAERVAARLAA
jgi:oxygen-dependent protoporphyrinogen oxidase